MKSVKSFQFMEDLVEMLRDDNFPKHVDKIHSKQDNSKMPIRSGLSRWQSVTDLHDDLIASGFSEFNSTSFKIQQDISDMSPPIYMKPTARPTELVANAVIMAISDSIKDCLHGIDKSHISQLLASVALKLESHASSPGCMGPADDCRVASDFTASDVDSGVDDASLSEVPFGLPNSSSNSSCDSDDDSNSVSCMLEDIVDEFRTKALRRVTEALYHSHSDMPDTPFLDILDLDAVALDFTEAFTFDIGEMLHAAHFRHLDGKNITDRELWGFVHSRHNCVVDKFIACKKETLSVDDHKCEQTDTAGSETKSWRLLQTPRPVMILETIPEMNEPSADSSCNSEKSQSAKSSKTKKKHFHLKLKNPFKKAKKGQKAANDSVGETKDCLTNTNMNSHSTDSEREQPRWRSIFSRMFSCFSCIS